MLNIGMISGWHVHAAGYAEEINSRDDAQVKVIWDEEPQRGQSWAADINAEFEADLEVMLTDYDLDGVVVNAPTSIHGEVIIKAARAQKDIFTEKVLTLTEKEGREVVREIEKYDVQFCISFPHRTRPEILFAQKMIQEDQLGQISLVRIRNAHDGASGDWLPPHFYDPEQCGGGAMVDLGAHGMYLARWLLGQPRKVTSVFNNLLDKPVEDNAVSTIEFENDAVAINETGFVTPASPFSLEVHGTRGSLFIGGPENEVKFKTENTSDWETPSELPPALPDPVDQWLDALLDKGDIHFDLQDGLQLTELMEKSYRAHKEDQAVYF